MIPTQKKPDDWDDTQPKYILGDSTPPPGWREDLETHIPNPNAVKPPLWNDQEDGEWIPDLIPNPECKDIGCGKFRPTSISNPKYRRKWYPPLIDNPAYVGPWKPRQIVNQFFYTDLHPHNLPPIVGLGIELWTTDSGIMFDNILITHNKSVADDFAQRTFLEKRRHPRLEPETVPSTKFDYYVWPYLSLLIEKAFENIFSAFLTLLAILIPVFFFFGCVFAALSSKKSAKSAAPGPEKNANKQKGKELKNVDPEKDKEPEGEVLDFPSQQPSDAKRRKKH